MSQSHRLAKVGLALATGLIALIGFVPTSAIAGSSNGSSTVQQGPANIQGPGWCC
ncbi:MAG: hypothetical protein QOI51_2578 [Nocardioidaceae bacterium]|jgi:hypothetical protein|nr:hypothetical protein [Nocardioidaceae bacterium]MDX6309688.1 hypothetical protein [Nocardioidaceae bacterium]